MLTAGYFQPTYWVDDYWEDDFWPDYQAATPSSSTIFPDAMEDIMWMGKSEDMQRACLGQYGVTYIDDTDEVTGDWFKIQVITDTVFNTLTGNYEGSTITGDTIPAGTVLYGAFTVIDLTSGSVAAYKMGMGK